jgi:hypothetical protein
MRSRKAKKRPARSPSQPRPQVPLWWLLEAVTSRGQGGQSFGESEPLLALRRALDATCTAPEPLIVWEGKDRLAAADVDFHAMPYESRHPQGYLYQLIERVQPRPSLAWSTHGRGLRLIYTAAGGYTAEELAAASALSISSIDPLATVEIKADSRHPKYPLGNGRTCGPIRELTQTADVSALAAWLGRKEVSEDQIEEWLTERGLEIGRRYEHACCPVRPQEPGNREPVTVRENGVFCHVCNGRGVTYGHRVPGWFPFAALTGATIPTQLRLCLENMTHWEHAKFVLTEAVSAWAKMWRGLRIQPHCGCCTGTTPGSPASSTPAAT